MTKRNKRQKDKQRSTKHTHKTKDLVTRTPLYFQVVGQRTTAITWLSKHSHDPNMTAQGEMAVVMPLEFDSPFHSYIHPAWK